MPPTINRASDKRADGSTYRGQVSTRRYPNFAAFIGTGAVLGAIIGGTISVRSPNASVLFSENAAFMFMVLAFGLAGAVLGAIAGVLTDLVLERRR